MLDRFLETPLATARAYLGLQAFAGAGWWISVYASEHVQGWTLGGWDPNLLVVPDLALFVGASAVAAATGNRFAALLVAVWTTAITAALAIYGLVERAAGWGVVAMGIATAGTLAASATIWFGRPPTGWFFIGPFSFRVAADRSDTRHLARSLAQLVVFWTTFFLIVPLVLSAAERRLRLDIALFDGSEWQLAGVAILAAGSALGLWSCVTMAVIGHGTPLPAETARDLVIAGPYRYVRNPMAVAGAFQTAAVGVLFRSWSVVAIAIAGAVIWNVMIRPVEEDDLLQRFGANYERYRREVRCWIP